MALTINTNVLSLDVQRNLNSTQGKLNVAIQRLSSGLRINSAKDDAAGLAISARMTSQVKGLDQAVRNSNDGISLAQTAEGALQEETNCYQRIRELCVEAVNGTLSTADWTSLADESLSMYREAQRIAKNTEFNGKNILYDPATYGNVTLTLQVGANAGQTMAFTIGSALPGFVSVDMDLDPIVSQATASDWIGYADEAIGSIDTIRSTLGAIQNRLTSTVANLENVSENISAAKSQITDADYATETAKMTKNQILQQAGVAMLSQTNQLPQTVLSLLKG